MNILIKQTRLMEIFEAAHNTTGIRSTKNRKNIDFANFSSALYLSKYWWPYRWPYNHLTASLYPLTRDQISRPNTDFDPNFRDIFTLLDQSLLKVQIFWEAPTKLKKYPTMFWLFTCNFKTRWEILGPFYNIWTLNHIWIFYFKSK